MKSLKTLAANIKVEWHRLCFNPDTNQTDWIADINGMRFEFHTGLRACVSEADMRQLKARFDQSDYMTFKQIASGQVKASKNLKDKRVMEIFEAISRASKPTAYDLLYSLQSDSTAEHESFDDWCGNFGYDSDSRKAFVIYEECQKNAKKLRLALGNELFAEVMAADPDGEIDQRESEVAA